MLDWFFGFPLFKKASAKSPLLQWAEAARELRWQLAAGRKPIYIDYPPVPQPRYGFGMPPHPELHRMMDERRAVFSDVISSLSAYSTELSRIPVGKPSELQEPYWSNGWFGSLNAATLYAFIRQRQPRLYLEVGSGNSTKFARKAIRDGQIETRIISIDPAPRAEIDRICDTVIRAPLENTDLTTFGQLTSGDILLVDNSHRCLQNSDVTVFFLEVLPRLPAGVMVYIDDIFLPYDYPPEWSRRFYSEQYVLASMLLAGQSRFELTMPCAFAEHDPELSELLRQFWTRSGIPSPAGLMKGLWLMTI